jgi:cytochrome P450
MADFNPFDPRLRANPYEVYRELRDQSPVYWSPFLQMWMLTRFDDCMAVLRDHVRFSSERLRADNVFVKQMEDYRMKAGPIGTTLTMLSSDPPAHTRMRNLVNKAFTPRSVEVIRPRIQEIADSLLDALPSPHEIDVVRDLAVPLPVIVIAEVLGVPAADREQFKEWSTDIASTLGAAFQPQEMLDKAQRSSNAIADYFRAQIAERRKTPRDDMLSRLVAAEENGDLLSEDELVATLILLLVAGNETTTNLIGNGALLLLNNPDQRRLLQGRPDLRYDGPAQMTSRVMLTDVDFQGHEFKTGQVVLAVIAGANHDPAQYADPDRFDIARNQGRNLAFGHGIHYCIGAGLAMAEAEVAIATLLKRFPAPQAAFETPDWGPSFILRGLKSLPLTSEPVPA